MKKILLDTNSYSQLVGRDNKIKKEFERADIVILPAIVLGELYSGFCGGNQFDQNELMLKQFKKDPKVVFAGLTNETAKIYGKLTATLNKKGSPIPSNDVWIAACAVETDSVLVSYDKHFLKIPGLRVWDNLKS